MSVRLMLHVLLFGAVVMVNSSCKKGNVDPQFCGDDLSTATVYETYTIRACPGVADVQWYNFEVKHPDGTNTFVWSAPKDYAGAEYDFWPTEEGYYYIVLHSYHDKKGRNKAGDVQVMVYVNP